MTVGSAAPAAPPAVSFDTAVRILAVAAGILSATLMARDGFNISLNEYLEAILVAYDDTLKEIALVTAEPAIKMLLMKVHDWFAIDLSLYPHWKHAFALLWLFFGALARSFGSRMHQRIFYFAWGGFCALAGGIMAGTVSLGSAAIFWWALASYGMLAIGLSLWHAAATARLTETTWFVAFVGQLVVALAELVVVLLVLWGAAIATDSGAQLWPPRLPFSESGSPGLAALAIFIVTRGVWYAVAGAWGALDPWARRTFMGPNAYLHTALDIFSVLGGATFLVWFGHVST